jgi:hypothetical protein
MSSISVAAATTATPAAPKASSLQETPPVAETPAKSVEPPKEAKAKPAAETVTISSAARAALAQEAAETPAQTAAEAQNGDRQAQHLVAKAALAKQGAVPQKQ